MSTNILLRSAGSPLKWGELDQNFLNIQNTANKLIEDLSYGPNSGYSRFSNGVLLQWGKAKTLTGKGDTFNFNIAFRSVAFIILGESNGSTWVTGNTNSLSPTVYGKVSMNNTSFVVNSARIKLCNEPAECEPNLMFFWLAAGV